MTISVTRWRWPPGGLRRPRSGIASMLVSAKHMFCPWAEGENAPVHSSCGGEGPLDQLVRKANDSIFCDRLSNPAGVGVRHSQELHLYSSAPNGCRNAQGCQGAPILGLEYRKEEGVGAVKWHHDGSRLRPDQASGDRNDPFMKRLDSRPSHSPIFV
jgi:hypothetical protein